MDNKIIDTLIAIRDIYGDAIFYNHTKTKNLLHDLSPDLHKERIQVANFLEMNGYFQLKYAGKAYPIIRSRLINNYVNTYAVSESAAVWVVNIFASLLGYSEIRTSALYVKNETPRPRLQSPAPAISVPSPKPLPAVREMPKQILDLNYTRRISADYHTVAITYDGKVLAAGPNEDGQCNVFAWRDIIAVSAGAFFTVGLCRDGRVVAVGRNDFGQCNTRNWTDIVAISAGARHTVGLRSDGSVVAAGRNLNGECNVHNWRNIIHVSAGYQSTFGIKKDRRVLVRGNNREDDLMVSHLNNVSDIVTAAPNRGIALLTDGSIARVGKEDHMRRNFSQWKGIRHITASPDYFAGLTADGKVKLLAYFWEDSGIECNVDDWQNMLAVTAGRFHIVGLRADGTMMAVMMHPDRALNKGQCNVRGWQIFPDSPPQTVIAAKVL